MVSVVGLTGCVAVLAVDLFIRAKDDQIAKRLEYAEPLPKNGLGVGVVFQQGDAPKITSAGFGRMAIEESSCHREQGEEHQ